MINILSIVFSFSLSENSSFLTHVSQVRLFKLLNTHILYGTVPVHEALILVHAVHYFCCHHSQLVSFYFEIYGRAFFCPVESAIFLISATERLSLAVPFIKTDTCFYKFKFYYFSCQREWNVFCVFCTSSYIKVPLFVASDCVCLPKTLNSQFQNKKLT